MKLDIGGGTIPQEGFTNLDPNHGEGDYKRYIQDGIPLPDNSVEEAGASHVFEHIPAGRERIEAMNEIYRVLEPGATFTMIVPTVGSTGEDGPIYNGWQPWADPTHVSYWWYLESFLYFVKDSAFAANADYGLKYWELADSELRDGWEAVVLFRKPE